MTGVCTGYERDDGTVGHGYLCPIHGHHCPLCGDSYIDHTEASCQSRLDASPGPRGILALIRAQPTEKAP